LISTLTLGAISFTGAAAAELAPVITHAPRVALPHGVHQTWAASNWSGYAETAQTGQAPYTGVSSTWTVPAVSCSRQATYSSAWIGVDGFNNSNLIQTGTEEDCYFGAQHYNAWWEILPAAETALPTGHAVFPGDRMSASIYETSAIGTISTRSGLVSAHVWVINISDTTASHSWSFNTSQPYAGPGASAEWIVEAPQVGGRIANLANYNFNLPPSSGLGDFDNTQTTTGVAPTLTSPPPTYINAGLNYQNDSGVMIQGRRQVSTPGNPDSAQTAYDAVYGPGPAPAPNG
jgi:hypothetical protein